MGLRAVLVVITRPGYCAIFGAALVVLIVFVLRVAGRLGARIPGFRKADKNTGLSEEEKTK